MAEQLTRILLGPFWADPRKDEIAHLQYFRQPFLKKTGPWVSKALPPELIRL